MGGLERAWGLTNHEIVIQVNLNKLANYIIVQAQTMVTNVTSYDVLVGGGWGGYGVPFMVLFVMCCMCDNINNGKCWCDSTKQLLNNTITFNFAIHHILDWKIIHVNYNLISNLWCK